MKTRLDSTRAASDSGIGGSVNRVNWLIQEKKEDSSLNRGDSIHFISLPVPLTDEILLKTRPKFDQILILVVAKLGKIDLEEESHESESV